MATQTSWNDFFLEEIHGLLPGKAFLGAFKGMQLMSGPSTDDY